MNSGTRLPSNIPETKNVVVQEAPGRSSYVLKTGNGKRGSLKMVTEFPPPPAPPRGSTVWSYWSRRSSLRSFLEKGPTTSLIYYLAGRSSGHKNTQIKGLEFMSSFRRHLGCNSRFTILSMRLIFAYCTLTSFSSVRSPLKGFDLRPVSSHPIKPPSSLASDPFKEKSCLTLLHDDPLPAT